jgi:hypothetical protein
MPSVCKLVKQRNGRDTYTSQLDGVTPSVFSVTFPSPSYVSDDALIGI